MRGEGVYPLSKKAACPKIAPSKISSILACFGVQLLLLFPGPQAQISGFIQGSLFIAFESYSSNSKDSSSIFNSSHKNFSFYILCVCATVYTKICSLFSPFVSRGLTSRYQVSFTHSATSLAPKQFYGVSTYVPEDSVGRCGYLYRYTCETILLVSA